MEYKLEKGPNSNYEITINVDSNESNQYKQEVLKKLQKDFSMEGFRKGHVPLDIVEKNANPEYLRMGIYEEVIHKALHKIMDDYPNIKFIGQIYDLKENQTDQGDISISFKLDYYPEVEEKDEKRKEIKPQEIEQEVTESDIDQTLENLKKQYAQYKDTEEITENTVAKIKFSFIDENGNEIDKSSSFVGMEDFQEYKYLKNLFIGKKKGDTLKVEYNHEELPHILHYHKDNQTPSKINIEIIEVKEVVLPEMNQQDIQEFFQGEVKSYQDLRNQIKNTLGQQKYQQELVNSIDDVINRAKNSMSVQIPKTLVDEEYKSRMQSLEERFGGKEGLQKYYDNMSEEEKNKMDNDIRTAASDSLEKFFILRKLAEKLGISENIDRQTSLDAERKLYDKMLETSGKGTKTKTQGTKTSSSKKTTTKSNSSSKKTTKNTSTGTTKKSGKTNTKTSTKNSTKNTKSGTKTTNKNTKSK